MFAVSGLALAISSSLSSVQRGGSNVSHRRPPAVCFAARASFRCSCSLTPSPPPVPHRARYHQHVQARGVSIRRVGTFIAVSQLSAVCVPLVRNSTQVGVSPSQ
eukprot:gb/GEZJ01008846.1/.p1 GENE.gb/GEZJ01008846.1/~~gb/GEZJ01008846.1/.p1  ORF type:complete len:104 (+),score=8.03 gb/GEZJ01008846.1/:701-1012(+)